MDTYSTHGPKRRVGAGMKIHKFRFGVYPEWWSYCGAYVEDCYSLTRKVQMATYWSNVTCKHCLKFKKSAE